MRRLVTDEDDEDDDDDDDDDCELGLERGGDAFLVLIIPSAVTITVDTPFPTRNHSVGAV